MAVNKVLGLFFNSCLHSQSKAGEGGLTCDLACRTGGFPPVLQVTCDFMVLVYRKYKLRFLHFSQPMVLHDILILIELN